MDYATSDGTAAAGDDYTAKSGTLSFSTGSTTKTLSVEIEDDSENESDETFTVTLSNPSGADLGTATATGTIRSRKVEPLTARFEGMPSEHDGSEFTFELHFSESPEVPYPTLARPLVHARPGRTSPGPSARTRRPTNKNQSWTITVKPLGTGQIGITLPAAVRLHRQQVDLHPRRPQAEPLDLGDNRRTPVDLGRRRDGHRGGRRGPRVHRVAQPQLRQQRHRRRRGTLTISPGSTSATVDVTVLDDSHRRRRRDADAHPVERVERRAQRLDGHPLPKGPDRAFRPNGRGPRGRAGRGAGERPAGCPASTARSRGAASTATWGATSRSTSCEVSQAAQATVLAGCGVWPATPDTVVTACRAPDTARAAVRAALDRPPASGAPLATASVASAALPQERQHVLEDDPRCIRPAPRVRPLQLRATRRDRRVCGRIARCSTRMPSPVR